jgi:hypothetical protein
VICSFAVFPMEGINKTFWGIGPMGRPHDI